MVRKHGHQLAGLYFFCSITSLRWFVNQLHCNSRLANHQFFNEMICLLVWEEIRTFWQDCTFCPQFPQLLCPLSSFIGSARLIENPLEFLTVLPSFSSFRDVLKERMYVREFSLWIIAWLLVVSQCNRWRKFIMYVRF